MWLVSRRAAVRVFFFFSFSFQSPDMDVWSLVLYGGRRRVRTAIRSFTSRGGDGMQGRNTDCFVITLLLLCEFFVAPLETDDPNAFFFSFSFLPSFTPTTPYPYSSYSPLSTSTAPSKPVRLTVSPSVPKPTCPTWSSKVTRSWRPQPVLSSKPPSGRRYAIDNLSSEIS